jgi:carboxyl-terminal processing protease
VTAAVPVAAAPAPSAYALRRILSEDYFRPLTDAERRATTAAELLKLLDDPYTELMDQDEVQSFITGVEGDFVVIGLGLNLSETTPVYTEITFVLPGSAAEQAGIKAGDRLQAIDGVKTAGRPLEDIRTQLAVPEGQTIILTLQREQRSLQVEVSPAAYHIPLLESRMLQGNILYIYLSSVGETIDQELQRLLDSHPETEGIILDFSDNPGGYVLSICRLADLVLPRGKFIGFSSPNGTDWMYLTQPARYEQPLICLVNGGSASAAEIFPAVIQDYQRGLVVGQQTYGKFSSQALIPLDDDWWLKYTFAQVLTAKSRNLNHLGLTPDVSLPDPAEAFAFAYSLLLSHTQAPTAHSLRFDLDANRAYADARLSFPVSSLLSGEDHLIRLRDAAAALQLPLQWDGANARISLTFQNRTQLINTDEDGIFWSDGYYYLTPEKLAGYVRGQVKWIGDDVVLYY